MSVTGTGHIYIISDGTGETASAMVRAALVQFHEKDASIVRCKNVRTEDQVDSLLEEAAQRKAFIVFTVVSPSMRTKILEGASSKGLLAVDLLGSLLNGLENYFGTHDTPEAGLLRAVDEDYFKRIEAMEFTVKHDDGKEVRHLEQADIILVGISRTSKTPLSIFLSHKGWKVANIPVVLNTPLPEQLKNVDQRKIVGLVIDSQKLSRIRRNRLEKFGQDPGGDYASLRQIQAEIEYSHELFKQNKKWPVFDVTERALEETASEIARIVTSRMGKRKDILF
jgi:[pyruvate, water dikinase]-phosphate phosphotransferase / [pyruvate, water dikinase] kinase